jgi:SAM-dependent methyltransferase
MSNWVQNLVYTIRLRRLHSKLIWRLISKLKNLVLDILLCGVNLGGIIRPVEDGAVHTESTDYTLLERAFETMNVNSSDVLVDLGCGKGRVIHWWLKKYPNNQTIGMELNENLTDKVKKRFENYPNVRIISGNILGKIPREGTVFYLYNPFDNRTLNLLKEELIKKFARREDITIIYVNCKHVDVFIHDSNWQVRLKDVKVPLEGIDVEVAFITINSHIVD